MSMHVSGLLRVPKSKPVKTENQSNRVIKQEFSVGYIKKEIKTENNLQTRTKFNVKNEHISIKNNSSEHKSSKRRAKGKRPFPHSKRKNQYSIAVHVHQNLINKDQSTLSRKQLDSLTWAEMVIVKANSKRSERKKNVPSLTISPDLPIRIKNTIPETLQLAIVDFGAPGGRYSLAYGNLIEKALGKAIVLYTLKNLQSDGLSYGAASWHDGVMVLDCKNTLSYDFARTAVADLKLWDRSILKAVPPEKNPFRSKVKLVVPDLGVETDKVLDILRSQNPLVNMKTWKIIEEENSINSCKGYVLMVDPPVKLLRNKQIKLFFGAGEVTLQLLACNWYDEN